MSLSCIWALGNLHHPRSTVFRRGLDGILQGLIEGYRVWHWPWVAPAQHKIPQVVYRHTRANDDDALVP